MNGEETIEVTLGLLKCSNFELIKSRGYSLCDVNH